VAEQVLQVDDHTGIGGGRQDREERGLHLLRDDPLRVGSDRYTAELIDIEDVATEEVSEQRCEGLPLGLHCGMST
jgi:hypothetical protein